MKKLKLDLDRIRVTSFATDQVDGGRGTVQGRSGITNWYNCVSYPTCEMVNSCAVSECQLCDMPETTAPACIA